MLFAWHLATWLTLQTAVVPALGEYDCLALIQSRLDLPERIRKQDLPQTAGALNQTVRHKQYEDAMQLHEVELATRIVQNPLSDQSLAQKEAGTRNRNLPQNEDQQAMRLRQVEVQIEKVQQLLRNQNFEAKATKSQSDDRRDLTQSENEHTSMQLHEAERKIQKLQEELRLAQAYSLDWNEVVTTLKTHWIATAIGILAACCILSTCVMCGPIRTLTAGEEGCECMVSCSKCCIETDIFCLRATWKLFYGVWHALHPRTQAAILGINLLTVIGVFVLWRVTAWHKGESLAESLLLSGVRWGYLGCVMCCLPGLMFTAVTCCELWACCADVKDNLGDYIMEAATDVAQFQQEVTAASVKGCTSTIAPCWQGCKKALGCSKDEPDDPSSSSDPQVAQVAKSLQVASKSLHNVYLAKAARKAARPVIMIKRMHPEGEDGK
mmetsp:Transcript_50528/g.88884  ORF Transcript_50528/g.88884 Transcript_50528/m.88884 type:complete len:438 (-) Transcript_50528:11-1324(-)